MNLVTSNAYKIFYAELRTHLASAQKCFEEGHLPTKDEIKNCGHRFHTIRGGAGFFGLDEISQVARQLEDILLNPTFDANAEVVHVMQLVSQICEHSKSLPVPNNA